MPTTVNAGQPVNTGWTVTNSSATATAVQPWSDRVWLSANNTLGDDTSLGDVQHTTNLAPGVSYGANLLVTIPVNVTSGTYFLILQTDALSQVGEENEANNTGVPVQITVP